MAEQDQTKPPGTANVNPYAIDYSQFQASLQPQQYQSTVPPNAQAAQGPFSKTGSIAMIADKFMEGFSRGRTQAFNQQEKARYQLNLDIDRARQLVEKSDLTSDVKAKMLGQLNGMDIMQVKNEVDNSKDKNHPQLKALKGIFDAMMGPAPKKYEWGPEQVHSNINQILFGLQDDKNTVNAVGAQANNQIQDIIRRDYPKGDFTPEDLQTNKDIGAIRAGAQKRGVPVTAYDEALTQAQSIQKHNQAMELEKAKADATSKAIDRRSWADAFETKYHRLPANELEIMEGRRLAEAAAKPKIRPDFAMDSTGALHAIERNLSDPDAKPRYADGPNKGKEIPDEWSIPNIPYMTAENRALMWGEYGGYLKEALGRPEIAGIKDKDQRLAVAKAYASAAQNQKRGTALSNTEQQMAVRWQNEGVRPSLPSGFLPDNFDLKKAVAAAGEGQPAASAAPPTEKKEATKVETPLPPYSALTGDKKAGEQKAPPVPAKATPTAPTTPNAPKAASPSGGRGGTPPIDPSTPLGKMSADQRDTVQRALINIASGSNRKSGATQNGLIAIQNATGVTPEEVFSRQQRRADENKALDLQTRMSSAAEGLDEALKRHTTVLKNVRAQLTNSDITRLNEWMTSLATEFNIKGLSPAAAQYGPALAAVRNEYSRVIASAQASSGVTPVEAMRQANEIMKGGLEKGNLDALLTQLQTETTQKIAGYHASMKKLMDDMRQPLVPELYGQQYRAIDVAAAPTDTTSPPQGGMSADEFKKQFFGKPK